MQGWRRGGTRLRDTHEFCASYIGLYRRHLILRYSSVAEGKADEASSQPTRDGGASRVALDRYPLNVNDPEASKRVVEAFRRPFPRAASANRSGSGERGPTFTPIKLAPSRGLA